MGGTRAHFDLLQLRALCIVRVEGLASPVLPDDKKSLHFFVDGSPPRRERRRRHGPGFEKGVQR